MTASKEKKEAPDSAASKATSKAAAPTTKKAGSSRKPASKSAAAVNGAEQARRRRLERFGCPVPRCALLGVNLDTSARSGRWRRPVAFNDEWFSELAILILESGVSPEALERAATRLRARGDE